MARYLLPPSHLTDVSRILSATSERGAAIRQGPVSDDGNTGTLKLWAEHVHPDVSPTPLTISLEAGGNPEGYIAGGPTVTAGARVVWRLTSDGSTDFRGWVDRPFSAYGDRPAHNDGSTAHGPASHLVECHNGRAGFVAYRSGSPNHALVFRYKSERFEDWTEVVVHGGGVSTPDPAFASAGHQPGLLITDAGRLIAYARVSSPYNGASGSFVAGWFSDDHGSTWAQLNIAAATLLNDSDILNAHWCDGKPMLICGESAAAGVDFYTSTSEGVSFSPTGTGETTLYRPRTTWYNGAVMVHADDDSGAVHQVIVGPGGQADDTDDWRELTFLSSGDNKQRCLITDDQDRLWFWSTWDDTNAATRGYYSSDGGATWTQAGPDATSQSFGLDNSSLGSAYTMVGLNGGMLGASMVVIGRTEAASGTDGHLLALYLGGWNRSFSEESYSEGAGDLYAFQYLSIAGPDSQSWTQTDVGAGATVGMGVEGWQITGTAANATDYQAPSNWRTAMGTYSGARVRAVINTQNSVAGSTADSRCRLRVQLNVAGGAQWVELRFGRDTIAAYDSSGSLSTAPPAPVLGSEDFVDPVEYLIQLEADAGSAANTAKCTIWYRKQADGDAAAWSTLIEDQDIARDGGASGDDLRLGGAVAGNSSMYVQWLALATDPHGVRSGADGRGRPLANDAPMYLDAGLAVGGYGTSGVTGDAYTLNEVAAFPKEAVWRQASPSEQCQSTGTGTTWRVVFDAGVNGRWRPDMVQLHGINFRTAKVEFNATDSWGSPTYSHDLSSAVRAEAIDAAELGGISLDIAGDEMIPHEFASKTGQRYFVHFAGTGNVYEITDNSDTFLYVDGVDLTSETGTATIYMDRLWGAIPNSDRRYMAITVASQNTVDGWFSLGAVVIGEKVTMNAGDGSDAAYGWSRGTSIPVTVERAVDGYTSPTVLGGPQQSLVLPMLESVEAVRPWHAEVEALTRYLNGPGTVVGVVLDSNVAHLHKNGGLFRLTGTTTKRVNVHGAMGSLERVKVSALSLEEIL